MALAKENETTKSFFRVCTLQLHWYLAPIDLKQSTLFNKMIVGSIICPEQASDAHS